MVNFRFRGESSFIVNFSEIHINLLENTTYIKHFCTFNVRQNNLSGFKTKFTWRCVKLRGSYVKHVRWTKRLMQLFIGGREKQWNNAQLIIVCSMRLTANFFSVHRAMWQIFNRFTSWDKFVYAAKTIIIYMQEQYTIHLCNIETFWEVQYSLSYNIIHNISQK